MTNLTILFAPLLPLQTLRRDLFPKESLSLGDKISGNLVGSSSSRGTYQIKDDFRKCIFQKSEPIKSENFPHPWWNIHLTVNPRTFYGIMKELSLRLIDKRFQRLCHVQFLPC